MYLDIQPFSGTFDMGFLSRMGGVDVQEQCSTFLTLLGSRE